MKHSLYIKFLMPLTAALLSLLTSCSSDMPEVPGGHGSDDDQTREVVTEFYITVGDVATDPMSARSAGRATPDDGEYDPGEGYENYINVLGDDFRVLFFSGEADGSQSRYITELDSVVMWPVFRTPTTRTYRVTGSVPKELIADGTFRMMMLANWGEYSQPVPGVTTIDQMCADQHALYSFDQAKTEVSRDATIPMYGIKRLTNVAFQNSTFTSLGVMYMLRAYAKVDVELTDRRWSMSSVELTNCYATGCNAPARVYEQGDYVRDTYDLDYTDRPHLPSTSLILHDLKFSRASADSSVYRIYMPEFLNIDSDGNPVAEANRARIRVKFIDRNTGLPSFLGEKYIDFKYYQAPARHPELQDKHINVMRNYWYKFSINKDPEIADLNITLDVQPYASVELDPGFGLERDPIDGYIILKKITQNGEEIPTFMYDDRFDEYYDFQKYRLVSNYSEHIYRAGNEIKQTLKLEGDIWLIKRANHHTDDIGDSTTTPSLFYDAGTGIYYDYKGETLNVRYVKTSPHARADETETEIVDVDRDFQYNNIVLARGDNSVESAFYDFAHGNYKGAFDPDSSEVCREDLGTTEDLPDHEKQSNFMRRKTNRIDGGWVEIVPYWLIQTPRVCRLYYNIFTDRYYDIEGYCLQDETLFPDFEFNVSANNPYVILKRDSRDRATLYYRRDDAKYYQVTYTGTSTTPTNTVVVDRPAEMVRDPRLTLLPAAL